jgi:hypothetical protein
MRRLAVPIPPDATGHQLAAVAALADQLGQGQWNRLAASFNKLDQKAAYVPGPMGALLADLAAGLRRAAADREQLAELELES